MTENTKLNRPLIFNIQKWSTHDGPGIRTTIFFKGCPIKCLWCHNPESQNYEVEYSVNEEGKRKKIGDEYTVKELVDEILKDQVYYDQSGGGVTLSGGEVMTQDINYIVQLTSALARRGVSVAIDTSGVAPSENFEKLSPYVDIWLYDLKFLDNDLHQKYTGASNKIVLENLILLAKMKQRIHLRLILVDKINSSEEQMHDIVNWLSEHNVDIEQIDLLPYHNFGRNKYTQLGRDCTQNFDVPSDMKVESIKQFFESHGYKTNIGG